MSDTLQLEAPGAELAVLESMLPFNFDLRTKTKYISYRASGFTAAEARQLTGIDQRTFDRWCKYDPDFAKANANINNLRHTVAAGYALAEFLRNFRLAMEKDYQVLHAAAMGQDLSEDDRRYLNRIRALYTPDQLARIKQAVYGTGDAPTTQFNFTGLVLQLARERT